MQWVGYIYYGMVSLSFKAQNCLRLVSRNAYLTIKCLTTSASRFPRWNLLTTDQWSVILVTSGQLESVMVIKQRAISEEEKLARRQAILSAALELLKKYDYQEIRISSIAKKAGVAKGTIFLYFRTKEELFLQLQMEEYRSWFNDVNNRIRVFLGQEKSIGHIDEFVKIVVSSAAGHPTLIQLTPIMYVVLERNIDYKTALEFKRFLLQEIQTTGALIESCLPFLRRGDGAQFLMELQILLIGLIQSSHPVPLVEKMIRKEGLEVLLVNFEEKLQEILTLLLNGRKAIYQK